MLPSPKQSERDHAADISGSMTTDRILAAIDDEIARLNKVRSAFRLSGRREAETRDRRPQTP